jgi:hypothetical protein
MGVGCALVFENGDPATEGDRDFFWVLLRHGAGSLWIPAEQVDSVFRRVLKATT